MKCIIIEDEIPAQDILKGYIQKTVDIELLGVFNSALNANSILQSDIVDLIFLDINLPNISGLSYLKTLKNPPRVILTTAYTQYAAESYEYDTIIDYLVKPYSFERFLKSVNKIDSEKVNTPKIKYQSINKVTGDSESIFINVDKTLHKIELKDIIYIQSDRNYVTIITQDLSLVFIDTLKKWTAYLNHDNFVQIHRSFIVNIDYIKKLTGNIAYLEKVKIPIGKTYKKSLLDKVKPIN